MKTRPGMTLLELLVALVLSAVAVSTMVIATQSVTAMRQASGTAMAATMAASQARDLMTDVVSGAVASSTEGIFFQHWHQMLNGRADDRLDFVTRQAPGRETAYASASLLIDRDTLTVEEGLVLRIGISRRTESFELFPNASALRLQFLESGTWQDSWLTPTTLPNAVRIVVETAPGSARLSSLPLIVQLSGGRR